ncbi:MAG: methanogenesis marker 2 protein [Theionarchaea archaeon]|nr:methanogenesis marker 2 protein [Theionarchaea archaeon]
MLDDLIKDVKSYEGLTRKGCIKPLKRLEKTLKWGENLFRYGDDCAVLKWGDEFLLLASDGIWSPLASDPFWMGYCSVLVNVNDVYAMGGKPLAMVNVLSAKEDTDRILEGIEAGCNKFTSVAVSILGRAHKILTSFHARSGEKVVLALDLEGKQYKRFLNWDTTTMKSSEEVLYRLEALNTIADKELATSCKDVSNPGILGSLGMLLETSRVGALIDVEKIEIPEPLDLFQFVKMYPGYGFVLTVDAENVEEVTNIFEDHHISSEIIGEIVPDRKLILHYRNETGILFDFEKEFICGF